MKKIAISTLSSLLVFSSVAAGAAHADTPSTVTPVKEELNIQPNNVEQLSFAEQNMIKTVEQYVELKEGGKIGFTQSVPQDVYKKFELDKLQEHFDFLNSQVELKTIIINPDLTITNVTPEGPVAYAAVYGSWTYNWWGYERKFNNSQAKKYVSDLNTVANSGAVAGGLAATVMPIIGAGVAVTAAYYGLLATRVDANNKGKGVYVGITWAIVFKVNSL
ncbi:hypothetical protein OCB08_25140 [Bacillus cereus]|uniref:hypothetical protein n=1 Tax=Bacillus TaxID=1386 RepID=UPI0001A12BB9|nr:MULTISPECIES: hypothetical protein [Bacillus]AOM08267.1 hypothetical protein FORC24_4977 [Bacillus cereus]EEL73824.1 Surface antigen [Bacillus cereus AH676]KMP55252.1 hypothetical protein TU56_18275 [Bacillus cereus]MBJ9981528.1 hypothetical protein [Bacillus sp. S29]MBK0102045.1 hypothetical protein [Bacillus sp. S70]